MGLPRIKAWDGKTHMGFTEGCPPEEGSEGSRMGQEEESEDVV